MFLISFSVVIFTDRKALEDELADESDDDELLDDKFLNLEGDDGWFFFFFCILFRYEG
jgi:hypothetical protein